MSGFTGGDFLAWVRESGRDIVASVSGGKDSTAMALWLKDQGLPNRIHWVYADTGWEADDLYGYIEEVLIPLLGEDDFHRVANPKYPLGMVDLVLGKGAFPFRRGRFCTEQLKTIPIANYMKALDKAPDELVINAVGIRAAESRGRSKMMEWEPGSILAKNLVSYTWRPLINLSVGDVVALHSKHGVKPCDLYLKDKGKAAQRVGCWPCIMSTKQEIKTIAEDSPERIELIRKLEQAVGLIADIKRPDRPNKSPPSFFQAKTGGAGECWPIDKVVQWAGTTNQGSGRGHNHQLEIFTAENESDRGCQMWGLCSHPKPDGTWED